MSSANSPVPIGLNLAVVRGVLRQDPVYRLLSSGIEVLSFDLLVGHGDRAPESVPVIWQNPPSSSVKLTEGVDTVVIGRVHRRFFRVGGTTASRTEVHAETVLGARSNVRLQAALVPRLEQFALD